MIPAKRIKRKRLMENPAFHLPGFSIEIVFTFLYDKAVPRSGKNDAGRCFAVKSVMIRLSLVENVNKFVNIVSRYPFEMDLRAGRHVVDAKSILGIFSLDLSRPIAMDIYSDDCDALLEEIKPFMEAQ